MVVHQENIGVEQSILKGIQLAQTPYIGFVDGDDWISPAMYQTMLYAMQAHGADMVQCGALIDGTEIDFNFTSTVETVITNAKSTYYQPFFESRGTLAPLTNARWSKIYDTKLLQTSLKGLPQGVSIGEDLLLNLAYLCHSKKAIILADCNYYCYRSNQNSLTKLYSDKKENSILRLYLLLSKLAITQGFRDNAIVTQSKNAICSLMLDLLLSDLTTADKAVRLRKLHQQLTDKSHLLRYAKERPFTGRIALYFVHFHLYGSIASIISIAKKVIPM